MIIAELQPHDTNIAWSGQPFDTSTAIPVPDFERPAPEHDKPNATSIDTPLSSSSIEWDVHELARLHREGHQDAAHLNDAYYGVFDGQAPDGSGPIEYIAYKPLPPDVYAIKAARDAAYNDLDSGQKAMASGSLISALYLGVPDTAERLTRGIKNPTLRTIARRSILVLGYGSLIGGAAGCLGRSVAPPVSPTLPPPGGETSMPPTPHFTPEASATIGAPVEMVAAFPDALPEPGKPEVVAGLSSVMSGQGDVISTAPLDNRIVLALNEQGVKPFFGDDDKGNPIFSADVSVDGKKVCLPTAPEQIANKNDPLQVFNYIPDGSASPMVGFGSPDLLGKAGDSDNVIRYGATTNGQTDIAGILSPVLPSLENTDCAYGSVINADITPNPNDFNGAVVGVHYDPETGEIKAYNSPVLVDPSEATINVQANGDVLLNGQLMENRVWVGNATATPIPTFTPAPTFTPEPSATPTPAESAPTSCLDEQLTKEVKARFETMSGVSVETAVEQIKSNTSVRYGSDGPEEVADLIVLHNAILLGQKEIDIHSDGIQGQVRCVFVAFPNDNSVGILGVISDATINGVWSQAPLEDELQKPYQILNATDASAWVEKNIGKPVDVSIPIRLYPDSSFITNEGWQSRSAMSPLVKTGAQLRFGAHPEELQAISNSIRPNPFTVAESLNPEKEYGLFSSWITTLVK